MRRRKWCGTAPTGIVTLLQIIVFLQYREMKMRTALVNEEEKLKLLPLESQNNRIDGVWNLSSDQVEDSLPLGSNHLFPSPYSPIVG